MDSANVSSVFFVSDQKSHPVLVWAKQTTIFCVQEDAQLAPSVFR